MYPPTIASRSFPASLLVTLMLSPACEPAGEEEIYTFASIDAESIVWADTIIHGPEISIEVSSLPRAATPTEAQLESARRLLQSTRAAAEQYRDYRWARTEGGYTVANAEVLGRPRTTEWHLFNPDFMRDGRTLDPQRPESLMFRFRDGEDPELIGVMYLMPPGQTGPQIGGPITRWHYHPTVEFCMDRDGVPTRRAPRGNALGGGCPEGETNGPMAPMLHVWLVENGMGAFAHAMVGPDDREETLEEVHDR